MLLGYNTNGLAHHDPFDAIELLAEIGYRSVALTLDHGLLNPYGRDLDKQIEQMRALLRSLGMRSVVETGARFLLDARLKHEPTLVSPDDSSRARRVDFIRRAIDIASALGSDCVSLWSGVVHDKATPKDARRRLLAGLDEIVAYAERMGVVLGFEPEPEMLIATLNDYAKLKQEMRSDQLRLTLDVGHVHCQREGNIPQLIEQYGRDLVNIHIEDMRAGVHEHLQFGEGEMDFPPIIAALSRAGYTGPLHVELSRHSHMAPDAARAAYNFLAPLLESQHN